MADIRCLICNRVNDASAERCWYCNTMLPKPTGPLILHEREKLANLRKKTPAGDEAQPEPPTETPEIIPDQKSAIEEEIPDWLARIRKLKQEDEQVQEKPQPDWLDDDQPEWLRNLQAADNPELPTTQPVVNSLNRPAKPAFDESLVIHELPVTDDLDDIFPIPGLDQTDESTFEGVFEEIAEKPAEEVAEVPTDNIAQEPVEEVVDQPVEEVVEEPAESFREQVIPQELEIPLDLSEEPIAQENPVPLDSEEFIEFDSLFPTEEQLSSLKGIVESEMPVDEPVENAPPAAGVPFPILVDDLPEWLAKAEPIQEHPVEPDQVEEPLIEDQARKKLEKGRLPAWLQSLRPVAAVIDTPEPARISPVVEEQGVLAGISGTLPGVELADRGVKPQTFTSGLRVLPAQQRNAEIFRSLLQPEEAILAENVSIKSVSPMNIFVRVLVGTLILLAVIVPIILSGYSGVIPVLYPAEVVNSHTTVDTLQIEKPVLLVAHFEAGLAGEISWTAQPVLHHLVARGVPMVLTSTNVVGFAMLQDMVSRAAGANTGYVTADKVVEMGYLPGGAIGLGALVSDPRAALPFTTALKPIGDIPSLRNIAALTDYGALILITDNPEFARSWVEQVDQDNTALPMLAVVSAQAAPMIQPYADSGQIDGYVSGINGAVVYEILQMRAGSASNRFGSYQLSLLAVAVIIFFGGVISLILNSVSQPKKRGES